MKDFEVKNSKISWKWLFALRNFNKWEKVVDWTKYSKIISKEEFDNLWDEDKNNTQTIKWVHRLFSYPANQVNHSCNPNTLPWENGDFAIKEIKTWEEITTSYFWEDDWIDFICNCWNC